VASVFPSNFVFFGKYIPVCNIDDGILQVSLLTETGSTKDDTRLPTDEALQAQVS